MDRKEFQKLAIRTESVVEDPMLTADDYQVFTNALRGTVLMIEILDIYKKHLFYGRDINRDAIRNYSNQVRENLFEIYHCTAEAQLSEDQGGKLEQDHSLGLDSRVFHAILGTITEHGELAEALLTGVLSDGLDLVNICEEIGDSDWYKGLFFEATGIDWETVQKMIINKLQLRYPEKFTSDAANDRDLGSERMLLEESIEKSVENYESDGFGS